MGFASNQTINKGFSIPNPWKTKKGLFYSDIWSQSPTSIANKPAKAARSELMFMEIDNLLESGKREIVHGEIGCHTGESAIIEREMIINYLKSKHREDIGVFTVGIDIEDAFIQEAVSKYSSDDIVFIKTGYGEEIELPERRTLDIISADFTIQSLYPDLEKGKTIEEVMNDFFLRIGMISSKGSLFSTLNTSINMFATIPVDVELVGYLANRHPSNTYLRMEVESMVKKIKSNNIKMKYRKIGNEMKRGVEKPMIFRNDLILSDNNVFEVLCYYCPDILLQRSMNFGGFTNIVNWIMGRSDNNGPIDYSGIYLKEGIELDYVKMNRLIFQIVDSIYMKSEGVIDIFPNYVGGQFRHTIGVKM